MTTAATTLSVTGSTAGVSGSSEAADYLTWQENTTLLYDFLAVYNLEWPSLTVQWLKSQKQTQNRSSHAEFLLATHPSEPQSSYLYILDFEMPADTMISIENRTFGKRGDYSGFIYGNPDTKKFKMVKRIHYPFGEIHRARRSPREDSTLAAAIGVDGGVCVFETACGADPLPRDLKENEGVEEVKLRLLGHKASGWGIAWSYFDRGHLATVADDQTVCTWDVERRPDSTGRTNLAYGVSPRSSAPSSIASVPTMQPVRMFTHGHTAAPQTVIAHRDHPALFMTGGDDGKILLWDTRIPENEKAYFPVAKGSPEFSINSLDQSPFRTWLIASGGTDQDVCLWDIRSYSSPVAKLGGHSSMINSVAFNPHFEHYLASASADKRVNIWDLRDIGCDVVPELVNEGSSELMFSHGGHPAPVQDLHWAPDEDHRMYLASVCDGNQFHVWRIDNSVFIRESTDEPSEDESYQNDTYPVE